MLQKVFLLFLTKMAFGLKWIPDLNEFLNKIDFD